MVSCQGRLKVICVKDSRSLRRLASLLSYSMGKKQPAGIQQIIINEIQQVDQRSKTAALLNSAVRKVTFTNCRKNRRRKKRFQETLCASFILSTRRWKKFGEGQMYFVKEGEMEKIPEFLVPKPSGFVCSSNVLSCSFLYSRRFALFFPPSLYI